LKYWWLNDKSTTYQIGSMLPEWYLQ
jgi:hypothetical protein